MKKVFSQSNQLTTKTAGDRIKTARKEMKKVFITMIILAGMTAGAMMLSSFATAKQDAKVESSQIKMNDDWVKFREGGAYCDGDTDRCMGRGDVWINPNTYQARIRVDDSNYDLTDYTRKEGYNMRFWHGGDKVYYYVYINIRF